MADVTDDAYEAEAFGGTHLDALSREELDAWVNQQLRLEDGA